MQIKRYEDLHPKCTISFILRMANTLNGFWIALFCYECSLKQPHIQDVT